MQGHSSEARSLKTATHGVGGDWRAEGDVKQTAFLEISSAGFLIPKYRSIMGQILTFRHVPRVDRARSTA